MDKARFEDAFVIGRLMNIEQAVAYALVESATLTVE
jgi:hypothetical protein